MATTEILFKRDYIVALNGGAERFISCVKIYDENGSEYRCLPWRKAGQSDASFETIQRIPFKAVDKPDYLNERGCLVEDYDRGGYQTDRKKFQLYLSMSNIESVTPKWLLDHCWSYSARLHGGFKYHDVYFSRNVIIPEADELWNEWDQLLDGERDQTYSVYTGGIKNALYGPELDWDVTKKFDRLIEVRNEYAQLIERLESTPIDELVERYVR